MRKLPVLGALAALTIASANADMISLKAGYFFGQSFDGYGGQSVRLDGVELGADLTFFKLPLTPVELRLSPSVVFGGGLEQGGDDDGTLYRLLASAKFNVPGQKTYGSVGIGYAWAEPRGGAPFDSDAGLVTQFVLGTELYGGTLLTPQVFLEAGYTLGDAPYRGLTLSVGVRL